MIREYKDSDLLFLQEALVKLQEYLSKIDPSQRMIVGPNYREKYTELTLNDVRKKNGKIYIAEVNGNPVGMISCIIEYQDDLDKEELRPFIDGRITELFLDDEYRGHNIAQELVKACENYFIQNGCELSRIDVFNYNEIAKRFYDKIGYDEVRNIEMCKKL